MVSTGLLVKVTEGKGNPNLARKSLTVPMNNRTATPSSIQYSELSLRYTFASHTSQYIQQYISTDASDPSVPLIQASQPFSSSIPTYSTVLVISDP
ncbi:hypothetical protein MFRU_060g00190 [Monilinia fructicola]|uniref:Uncharacterized protein n=1 Tax=Monilinia fructicola TaxID=38448 RepID=A0A5M9JSH0_MONFR|nr:hypothetical protein EYC84_002109 [Monilinia fructicola]KAG4025343.1 hypothetical protein MFRU_060g00190 [Monilinia fructicola]